MDQMKIGLFISQLRKEKGITQAELAEYMGVSNRAVSKWEHGQSLPDAGRLLPLCDYFDITVNEFLCGERMNMSNMDTYQEKAEKNLTHLQGLVKSLEKLKNTIVAVDLFVNFLIILSVLRNFVVIFQALKGQAINVDDYSKLSAFPAQMIVFFILFLVFDIYYFILISQGKSPNITLDLIKVSVVAKLLILIIILVISCALGIPQLMNII